MAIARAAVAGESVVSRLTPERGRKYAFSARPERIVLMQGLRASLAAFIVIGVTISSASATPKPTATLGTIITADHARVGDAYAEVGTTIFSGDRLTTDAQGSVQIRAGAARLLLQGASAAIINDTDGAPSAKLLQGAATFSTGNARAFTLFASRAVIRAESDAPTIGRVTYLSERELLVASKRGPLVVTVDGETQIIPEGSSYRVVLDAMAQGPEGSGTGKDKDRGKRAAGPPLRAGRSYFVPVAIGAVAIITGIAISEALESPNRP